MTEWWTTRSMAAIVVSGLLKMRTQSLKTRLVDDPHAAPLVALGQHGEEHLHLVLVVLHVADVVEDEEGVAVELRQRLGQAQVALGRQQALHQRGGRGPQHRVALQRRARGRRPPAGGSCPTPGPPDGDDVDRVADEGARAQPLDLLADGRREALQLEGAEGLLGRQPRPAQQAGDAALLALVDLGLDQLVEEGLVGQVGLGRLERQVGAPGRRSPAACRVAQHRQQLGVAVRHGRPPRPSSRS